VFFGFIGIDCGGDTVSTERFNDCFSMGIGSLGVLGVLVVNQMGGTAYRRPKDEHHTLREFAIVCLSKADFRGELDEPQ
jgi:hypothetical protein